MTTDYHKLFELVIDELLEKAADNIEEFTYVDNVDDDESFGPFSAEIIPARSKTRGVRWNMDDDQHVQVFYNIIECTMALEIAEEDRCEIDIGYGTEYPQLKKKFMRLYKQVREYIDVQLEEESLEKFYSTVSSVFPNAINKLILGEKK